jgi:hypothetical protein
MSFHTAFMGHLRAENTTERLAYAAVMCEAADNAFEHQIAELSWDIATTEVESSRCQGELRDMLASRR